MNKEDLAQKYWKLKLHLNKVRAIIDQCDDSSSREELLLAMSTIWILMDEVK